MLRKAICYALYVLVSVMTMTGTASAQWCTGGYCDINQPGPYSGGYGGWYCTPCWYQQSDTWYYENECAIGSPRCLYRECTWWGEEQGAGMGCGTAICSHASGKGCVSAA